MDTVEQLRQRLSTCEDLRGLVRTMKALAAVSIHQHDQAVRALSVYHRTIEWGLQAALLSLRERPRPRPVGPDDPLAVVVFGSDHGLCGRFNEEVAAYAASVVAAARAAGAPLHVLAIGARTAAHLAALGLVPQEVHATPASTARLTAAVRGLLPVLDGWYARGIERLWLVHQLPLTTATHRPELRELLPLDLGVFATLEARPWGTRGRPMCTMQPADLLSALLRQHLFVSLCRACAESLASENGARLLAMQGASRALDERGEALGATLRRRRQDAITAELLDLLGGYEATGASETAAGAG